MCNNNKKINLNDLNPCYGVSDMPFTNIYLKYKQSQQFKVMDRHIFGVSIHHSWAIVEALSLGRPYIPILSDNVPL